MPLTPRIAADLRPGDVLHDRAGARMFAAFDVAREGDWVVVWTSLADQEAGWAERMELSPWAPIIRFEMTA